MAVRRVGMRRIVVDGVEYLWKFPRRPTSDQRDCWGGCAVFVQPLGGRGSILFVRFRHHHPTVAKEVGFPVVAVLPSMVAAAIRRALAVGWQPDQPGPSLGVDG